MIEGKPVGFARSIRHSWKFHKVLQSLCRQREQCLLAAKRVSVIFTINLNDGLRPKN